MTNKMMPEELFIAIDALAAMRNGEFQPDLRTAQKEAELMQTIVDTVPVEHNQSIPVIETRLNRMRIEVIAETVVTASQVGGIVLNDREIRDKSTGLPLVYVAQIFIEPLTKGE